MPKQSAMRQAQLKGNEAVVSQTSHGFEVVEPIRQAKDLVFYRDVGPGVVDPVQNAENQLKCLKQDYRKWLSEDCDKLCASWDALGSDPKNPEKFIAFHKAIHTISGNAAILDCPTASSLALPLARMLERRPRIENHIKMMASAVRAICEAAKNSDGTIDPRMTEIIDSLDKIVARWIARKR